MYVVDASVWVSRFFPSDSYHQPSRHWLLSCVERGELVVMPSLVLPEVAGAVARGTGLAELGSRAVSLLQRLPISRLVAVDADLAELSARLAADLRLRGADAVYVALAHRLSVSLVTWDQEQRERGGRAVKALTPEEAAQG